MTEPGKNRSPLELEVMELLELRENLQKDVARIRAEQYDEGGKLDAARARAYTMDPVGALAELREQREFLEVNIRDTLRRATSEVAHSLDRAIKTMEGFVEEKPEE